MKKLVFFTTVASPHQVRFIPYLRKYYDADFYFYDQLGGRQSWWKVDLGEHGHLLPCKFKWHSKYFTLSVLKVLKEKRPDILMLGGFSVPANLIAYWWGRLHGCKIVVQTERSRVMDTGELRGYTLAWRILHWLYRKVDLVAVTSETAIPQFRDVLRFGEKVRFGRYPSDIDRYYEHPVRQVKESYTIIYPNRMTDIYDPIKAVDIAARVLKRHPKTKVKFNAAGELRPQVEQHIRDLRLDGKIEFLDGIKSWDDLGEVYRSCDIMYFPAKYSNGNYTVTECAVSGMACVVSTRIVSGAAHAFNQYNSGAGLEPDVELFADKICWYMEHPDEFARVAPINRERYRPLTMEATARQYHELFERLF